MPAGRVGVRRRLWRRAWGWAAIPPAVPRQAPTRDRPYGCPYGACYGLPLWGMSGGFPFARESIFITMTAWWVDGARFGGRRFPPPCPARRPQETPLWGMLRIAPVGHVRWVPVCAGIYFHNNDGVVGRWRAFWWAAIPPAVPRQAPTRDRPYGACYGLPLWGMSGGFPFARESIFITMTAWWVDGARFGGRRFPPPCPARRPQETPLRFLRGSPTIPAGGRPCESCRETPLRMRTALHARLGR